jgi:hypothetical protein
VCKEVIDTAGRDGGFIMDASAIIQNDARPDNIRAMTDFTREYGQYGTAPVAAVPPRVNDGALKSGWPAEFPADTLPGGCIPWEEKRREIPEIPGDEALAKRIFQEIDGLGYLFIWHCLLSF